MEDSLKNIRQGPPWWRSTRYLLAFLAAYGYANLFFQRINLSMAVVCMVNHTAVDLLQSGQAKPQNFSLVLSTNATEGSWVPRNDSATDNVFHPNITALVETDPCLSSDEDTDKREDGPLVWSKETQGILLGGLYWGYMLLQVPSQRIIQRTGCKRTALVSVFFLSSLTMLAPIAATTGPWMLMAIRVLQGLACALGFPAIYMMWGEWAPPQDRTALMGICFSGSYLANAIVFPTSGVLCQHGFAGGWPSVFYVYGIVGFVWCVLWLFLMHETPQIHPHIDPDEKRYIIDSIGQGRKQNQGSIPWWKILSSSPVWAIVIAQLGYNWGFFMLLAVLPQYMKEVLKFDIQTNGFYAMAPHLTVYIWSNIWAHICQVLSRKDIVTTLNLRRLSTAIGDVVPAILYICVSFLDCSRARLAVAFMTLSMGISGSNLQGFLINPYDVAPRYATAILCLSNTISVASGMISPYIVATITEDKTREQWQVVFFLTAAIALASLVFYLFFGTAHEMEWAKDMKQDLILEIEPPKSTALPSKPLILESLSGEEVTDTDTTRKQSLVRLTDQIQGGVDSDQSL